MPARRQKLLGQYFTPPDVVASLTGWLLRRPTDTFLDPACGDGRFLQGRSGATGVDFCGDNCRAARSMAPHATIHEADFFAWAEATRHRFDAVGGNPPFIRYQHFTGATRKRASALAAAMGADFSGLASSWAPFVVVSASLLKPGGRLAFVVPAEIGHATYARPLLEALCRHFHAVCVVVVREKLFPELSEDAWLLYADGYGGATDHVSLVIRDRFEASTTLSRPDRTVALAELRGAGARLRRHILPPAALELYGRLSKEQGVTRLGDLATVGVGYVTGANDFFHLAPSQAAFLGIDRGLTRVAVRKGDQLPAKTVNEALASKWIRDDLPVLLLELSGIEDVPLPVRRYLDSPQGQRVRERYKCRVRDPWYAVPGVTVPDGFLSYMSGREPSLVRNSAACVCTNSVHAVRLRRRVPFTSIQEAWAHPLSRLSQEIEGHPLGGGMLKLEPREAANVVIPQRPPTPAEGELLEEAVATMRHWRHYE